MDNFQKNFTDNYRDNAKDISKEKIAIVVTNVATAYWFLRSHLKKLSELFDVTILLKNDDSALMNEMKLDVGSEVKVIEIPIERKIKIMTDIRTFILLFLIFRKESFKSVHTITPKAGLLGNIASYLASIPVRIHTFQGEVWVNTTGLTRIFFKFIDKLVVFLSTNIIVVSNSERDFLVKEGILKNGQAKVLGSGTIGGVDLLRFKIDINQKKIVRSRENYQSEDIVFAYIGRLNIEKGLETLIDAFKSLNYEHENAKLLIVGPDEDGTAEKIKNFSLQFKSGVVKILPFMKNPEEALIAADALVLPSFREGFGLVIIEAAAMGIPSIGSNIYGISDAIIDGKTGLLFDVKDSKDLNMKMKSFLLDGHLRKSLGNRAYERAINSFSQDIIMKHFIDYYKNLPIKHF